MTGEHAGADAGAGAEPDARDQPEPTWTRQATGVGSDLHAVASGGVSEQFIAVGDDGAIVRSPDGRVWTPTASGTTAWFRAIIFQPLNKLGFVAVGKQQGSGGPAILTSEGGVDWTERDLGPQPGCGLTSIVQQRPSLIAVGNCGLAFSDAGDWESWQQQDPGTGFSVYFQAAATYRNRGRFVAIARSLSGPAGTTQIYATDDATASESWPLTATVPSTLFAVAAQPGSDSIVVAVGADGAIVRSIGDDAVWQPVHSDTTADLLAVAHCWSRWIAVGADADGVGVVLESEDGLRWEQQPLDQPAPRLRGIGCGTTATVVVGDEGAVYLRN